MKTLLSYLTVAALVAMSSFTVNQQQELNKQLTEQEFTSFRIHREGKAGVTLNWAVSSADITCFVVERSYDGEFFEEVSVVAFSGSASYRFKDTGVFPGWIYYRVKAVRADASEEYSPVESVRIVQRG